jgi:hypothetical protein
MKLYLEIPIIHGNNGNLERRGRGKRGQRRFSKTGDSFDNAKVHKS